MNVHANARLTPLGRLLLCQRVRQLGWTVQDAAEAGNVSERTAYRWLSRYEQALVCAEDLLEAMADRSSRPESSPTKVTPKVEAAVERLRRLRWCSPAIADEAAAAGLDRRGRAPAGWGCTGSRCWNRRFPADQVSAAPAG